MNAIDRPIFTSFWHSNYLICIALKQYLYGVLGRVAMSQAVWSGESRAKWPRALYCNNNGTLPLVEKEESIPCENTINTYTSSC